MEVIIDGILAELGNSDPAITKQSVDIDNPSRRFLDFTNKFQLPDTIINRQIFNNPRGIGTNNRSFDKLYNVVIRDVNIIFRGKGILDESAKDQFSFQVVDNSKVLFDAMEISLKDVNWDDKDTQLTTTQIDTLDTIDEDNCWFWGKACYHQNAIQANTDQTTGDARCKYSRPAFLIQALLKRMITGQGYTFASPEPFLAISSNHSNFLFTSYQKTVNTTYVVSGTLAVTGLNTNDFAHADVTATSTTINIGTKKTKFRVRGPVSSDNNVTLTVRATDNADGTKVVQSKFTIKSSDTVIDFSTSEFQSDNGYTIDIFFTGNANVAFSDVLIYTTLSEEHEDLSTNPWLNYKIKAYDNLPELSYKDIFRTICVVSNKYQIVDSFNKTFSFGSLASLNKLNALDWSDKFVINSERINSKFKGLAKRNFLRYTNDTTVNFNLGEDYFDTDNENLPDEKDYIKFSFGASNEVEISGNTIVQLDIYNDTTRIADQEISIRLFNCSGSVLEFSPLDWKNLKSSYYQNWFNSFSRIRAMGCQFNLSKLDVLNWKEKDLVYIDFFKSTFIVLKIGSFIPGRLTTVNIMNYGR